MGVELPIPAVARVAPIAPTPARAPEPVAAPVAPAPPPAVAKPEAALAVWEAPGDVEEKARAAQQARELERQARRLNAAGKGDPDVATPGDSEYARNMRSTRFADTAPTPHRFHIQYTIRKGSVFACTPDQPIASDVPGPVRCTVDNDVWSMDGTTVLLPKGTQVNGSIEQALGNGAERLPIIWTDALTPYPDLQPIPLDSPGADELGQSGVPGDVNDHLWRKTKAALLLSLVDFAGSALTSSLSGGHNNTTLNFGQLGSAGSSLSQTALQHDINIPSTLYRAQGQPLTVYVNHYIDLFKFYQNVPVR